MSSSNEKGFTLMEMMVVVFIIALLGAITVPNLNRVFKKSNLRASTSSVTASLYLARMKAINDSEPYGVEFIEDGTYHIVRDPYGVNEIFGGIRSLEDGVIFEEITFVDWLAVFSENGQLHKSCLLEDEMTGMILLTESSIDSTWVEVTFLSGRIRETNR